METYIKDLNLSPEVKTALSWCLGITKVSDLEGLNYLTFANRCPKNYNVLAIADELNAFEFTTNKYIHYKKRMRQSKKQLQI